MGEPSWKLSWWYRSGEARGAEWRACSGETIDVKKRSSSMSRFHDERKRPSGWMAYGLTFSVIRDEAWLSSSLSSRRSNAWSERAGSSEHEAAKAAASTAGERVVPRGRGQGRAEGGMHGSHLVLLEKLSEPTII